MATMVNPQQPHMTEAKVSPPEGSFEQFAALCRSLFEQRMAEFGPHLFVVEFEKDVLNDTYLNGFADDGMRQHHNCSACRHFIERYGRLAFVKDGQLIPAIWPMGKTVDGGLYAASADFLYRAVQTGKISGVFLSKLAVLGTPISFDKVTNQPIWSHFAMNNPTPFKHTVDSAGQRMALKREHFGTMFRAVIDYGADVVKQALALCEGDTLYRTDKVSGPLKFLLQAIGRLAPHPVSSPAWDNVLWQIVAEGNPAQLTPRSSMTGTLLDDLLLVNKGEMTLDKAKARFADKMAPLKLHAAEGSSVVGPAGGGEQARREARDHPVAGAPVRAARRGAEDLGADCGDGLLGACRSAVHEDHLRQAAPYGTAGCALHPCADGLQHGAGELRHRRPCRCPSHPQVGPGGRQEPAVVVSVHRRIVAGCLGSRAG